MNKFAEISINFGSAVVDDLKVPNPQNIKDSIKTKNTPSKNEAENKISESQNKLSELRKLMAGCIDNKEVTPGDLKPYFARLEKADRYMVSAKEKFDGNDYVSAIHFVMAADQIMLEVYGNIFLIVPGVDSIKVN